MVWEVIIVPKGSFLALLVSTPLVDGCRSIQQGQQFNVILLVEVKHFDPYSIVIIDMSYAVIETCISEALLSIFYKQNWKFTNLAKELEVLFKQLHNCYHGQ